MSSAPPLKDLRVILLTVSVSLVASGSLRADLITFDNNGQLQQFINNNPPLTRENVVFNGGGTSNGPGMTMTGRTVNTSTLIDFSSTVSVKNQGIGQANISATVGTFNDLTIGPLNAANPGTFTVAAFSFDPDNGQGFPTSTTITVTEADDTTTPYNINIPGGQNIFFGIVAFNGQGQSIKKIEISGPADLDGVRQVDIGFGVVINPNPIPEPASIAVWGVLGGTGLAGLAWYRRRRFAVVAR